MKFKNEHNTMKMNRLYTLLAAALLLGALSSCVSQKKMAYVYGISAEAADSINAKFHAQREAHIVCGDALTITVNALDLEAVEAFNMPLYSPGQVGTDRMYSSYQLQYYLVDKDGNINFPTMGKLHVEGMTVSQLRDTLTTEISKSVNDPIVNVHFASYQVTVLGEVTRPGRYNVGSERVTIFDALGLAGDMTPYGKRENVLIARETEGKMQFERLNINNPSIFTSPFYYLQQNDVIYVEPNGVRAVNSQNISLYLSMITTLGSMATVIVSVVNTSELIKSRNNSN